MADDGKIHISLPSRETAPAGNLAESLKHFTAQLIAAGFHAPDVAKALSTVAEFAIKCAKDRPTADFGAGEAFWHDQIARKFNTADVPEWPQLCVVLFEMISGRTVPVQIEISDMRALGELLIAGAKKLAVLQVAKEAKG
jgi:hypothetical protein